MNDLGRPGLWVGALAGMRPGEVRHNLTPQALVQTALDRGEARLSADVLADRAHAASRRYRESLAPLMEQLRAAWGHGDSPQVFDTWQHRGTEPGTEPYLAPHAPARNAA